MFSTLSKTEIIILATLNLTTVNALNLVKSKRLSFGIDCAYQFTLVGADTSPGDGIYSAYILKKFFTGNSRYNIKLFVSGDDGTFTYTTDLNVGEKAAVVPGGLFVFVISLIFSNMKRVRCTGNIAVFMPKK